MLSANFKPKRTAAASCCFLATARLSCIIIYVCSFDVASWSKRVRYRDFKFQLRKNCEIIGISPTGRLASVRLKNAWRYVTSVPPSPKSWHLFYHPTNLSERMQAVYDSSTSKERYVLSLYHNCDSATIRLRYDDATTHSTTTKVIEITFCLRFDCDTTTTRLRRKTDTLIFCSRRIASNGSRRARYVVVGS